LAKCRTNGGKHGNRTCANQKFAATDLQHGVFLAMSIKVQAFDLNLIYEA
jgi:hypothetical protein